MEANSLTFVQMHKTDKC